MILIGSEIPFIRGERARFGGNSVDQSWEILHHIPLSFVRRFQHYLVLYDKLTMVPLDVGAFPISVGWVEPVSEIKAPPN